MMNEIKKYELNEQEMNQVTGGCYDAAYLNIKRTYEQLKKQEEARKKAEAARQSAMQNEAARQEAIRQAEAANQPGTHVHGGGASGGW